MKEIFLKNTENETSDSKNWEFNRRNWLKITVLGLVAVQLPWLVSCDDNSSSEVILDGKGILTEEEIKFIFELQNSLVPKDGNGPSANDVNAHNYFVWTLSGKNIPQEDRTYFIEKTQEFMMLCEAQFLRKFTNLSSQEKTSFIDKNIQSGWTRTYISRMITVIFEAILLDPVYDVNPNEIGWNWLQHSPGMPRPTLETKFPEIYKTVALYD